MSLSEQLSALLTPIPCGISMMDDKTNELKDI